MTPALGMALRAPLARVLLIAGLALLLQMPSCMIGNLARERQQSRDAATAEVFQTWGAGQQLAGPFLAVPYRVDGLTKKGEKYVVESGTVVLLPDRLEVRSRVKVETLRRGLFEVPVYRAGLTLDGRFKAPLGELAALVPPQALRWQEAQLVLRVRDVHGLERIGPLHIGRLQREFRGGTGVLAGSGLHASLADLAPAAPADFSIELDVRGSSSLHFTPTARDTTVALAADWPHPKFMGSWLPDRRDVTAQGFSATWKVSSLAGGLPPASKRDVADDGTAAAVFGVELLNPIDPYRMSERTLKYDLLFLGLTFVVVWLFEQLAGRSVHAVQYVLLGAALALFYLLELSLAEHIGFAAAYALAAGGVTAQVFFYARSVFSGWRPALGLMAVVGALYAFLYLLLQVEDYALLIGAASLFVVLSAIMYLTRRVRWGDDALTSAAVP